MPAKSRAFRRIAAALMLTSSLTFASVALSARAEAKTADPVETFLSSQYTYCDAKLVAGLWKISIDQAKAEIGQKILNGIGDNVPVILAEARQSNACEWADLPLGYDDAEKLAKVWGLGQPYEAKDKAAMLYTQGRSAEVTAALSQAPADPAGSSEETAVNVFYDSGFTYCDAKLVGAAWGIDVWQGKVTIGNKVINNMAADVEPILVQGRQVTSCDFFETDLSYEDAEKLASVWGVSVEKAKDKAALEYTQGHSAAVKAALAGEAVPTAGPTPIITVPPAGKVETPPSDGKPANEN